MSKTRDEAMKWWNELSLEDKFYTIIPLNHLIQGDSTRHPNTLTRSEIEKIFNAKSNLAK